MISHIGYLIKSINDKIKIHADEDLKSHDLTLTQSRVLIYLVHHGGKATQKEIETFLEVSHPTVVGIVSRMTKNGYLSTSFDPDDRRNKDVELTKKAHETGKDMDHVIGNMEKRMLSPLSDDEITQLTEMLEKVYDNLR